MFKFGKGVVPTKSLIAIVSSEVAEAQLNILLNGFTEFNVKIKRTDDVYDNGRTLVNGSADVVIVEADIDDPRSETVLRELCRYVSKDGAMIVISNEPSIQMVRKLFKLGVSDVLPLPLNSDEFYKSIRAASQHKATRNVTSTNGKVITITKSNGGVGGTSVALNLANHIRKSDKFTHPISKDCSVAVFDFNVQFGAAALNLNLKSHATILDILQAKSRLDEELLYSSILKHESGLTVLAAPNEVVPTSAFTPEFFETLLSLGRRVFDYVVIDMPLVWTSSTPKIFKNSDIIIPVMHPLVEHVQNMTKFYDGLASTGVDKEKTFILANRIETGPVYKQRIEQIRKRFKRPVLQIRKDDQLHKIASDRGQLIDKINGNKNTLKDYDNICHQLSEFLMAGEQFDVNSSHRSGLGKTEINQGARL